MTYPPAGQYPTAAPQPAEQPPAGWPGSAPQADPGAIRPSRSRRGLAAQVFTRAGVGLVDLAIGAVVVAFLLTPGTISAVHSAAPSESAWQLLFTMVTGGASHPPTMASLAVGIAILVFCVGAALSWIGAGVESFLGDLNGPAARIAGSLTWVLGGLALALASTHDLVVPWLAPEMFGDSAVRLDLGWIGTASLLVVAVAFARRLLVSAADGLLGRTVDGLQLVVLVALWTALFGGGVLGEDLTSSGLTVAGLAGPALLGATELAGWLAWALLTLVVASALAIAVTRRLPRASSRLRAALSGWLTLVTVCVSAAFLVALNLAYAANLPGSSASFVAPFRPANWFGISTLVVSLLLVGLAFAPKSDHSGADPVPGASSPNGGAV